MIKKTYIYVIAYLAIVCIMQHGFSQSTDSTKAMIQNARIGRGVNLGNALEAPSIGAWGVELKEEYFELIAKKGFNSVRVPIRWSAHATTSTPYGIDASFFQTVDWVIENSFKNGLYVIINFHHYEELYSNPDTEKERFLKLWELICNHYKDYSDSLIFEILNEPHGNLTPTKWNGLLSEAYTTIRQLQPDRTLIVGTANYGGVSGLSSLKLPASDDNMILTIHYYNPFHFTHQGAGWVSGDDAWLGTTWNNTLKARQTVMDEMKAVVDFSEKHNIPVYMGEFGAYSKADYQSRVRWTNFIPRYFEQLGFSWAYWEFCSGFGVYNDSRKSWNEGLLYALLHMPMSHPANADLPPDTVNLVTNADFSDSTEHWYIYKSQDSHAEFDVETGEGTVNVLSQPGSPNTVSLINSGIQLESKRAYRVSFDAYADSARAIDASVMQGYDPWIWRPYSEINTFQITTEKTRYQFYFMLNEPTDHNARLRFDMGHSKSKIYIDNVKIEDLVNANDTSHKKISVVVKDIETDDLLENATISIAGNETLSSASGEAEFSKISVGYHDVGVKKEHYQDHTTSNLPIYKDTTHTFYLAKRLYSDTIKIRDMKSGMAISGVMVTMGDEEGTTNLKGKVVFNQPFGTYQLTALKEGYSFLSESSHTLDTDTTRTFYLSKTHANVKFKITSDYKPLNNATVVLDNDTLSTNNLGIATFNLMPFAENYEYRVHKYGYANVSGNLNLDADTLLTIEMQKTLVDIKFNILSNDNPVDEALVILENDTSMTNSNGLAGFYNYPVDENYTFHIVRKGFEASEIKIFASNDTVIELNLVVSSMHWLENESLKTYPNPVEDVIHIQSEKVIQKISIYNLAGILLLDKAVNHATEIDQDISFLESGNYMLKIIFRNGSEKIVQFIKP